MHGPDYFCDDYATARGRFRAAAEAAGLSLAEHPLGGVGPEGEALTLDTATRAPRGGGAPALTIIISSGLHGVEGYFGSAVQLALLDRGLEPPPDVRLVFVHALNPHGFAWVRRVNEGNIDLNRNFLLPGEAYSGSPDGYAALDGLLNPAGPPSSMELFTAKALWHILRRGFGTLKSAVAGGQYDFPQGIFFGGGAPSDLVALFDAQLPEWVGGAPEVLHIDLHTGLGKPATYALIVDRPADHQRVPWLQARFGADVIQPWSEDGVSYAIRGGMGTWCQARMPEVTYDVLTAEFGTVPPLKVLRALRAENQAHHHCERGDPRLTAAKATLKETFIPASAQWRQIVVERGLKIVDQALAARAHLT